MLIEISEGTLNIPPKYYITETQVTEFKIPASVDTIGEQAFTIYTDVTPTLTHFTVHKDNKKFKDIDGVLTTKKGDKLIAFPIAKTGTYEIPSGIKIIGKYAFRMATNLTEIIIPDSVEKIEKGAFCYCKSLKTLKIGNGCKSIGANAFESCSNLNEIYIGNNVEKIQKKAFYKCDSCGTIRLSEALKEIEKEAFYGMHDTHFILGKHIKQIGERAFVGKNLSLDISKKQKGLLQPEIFAMNDKWKFSVAIHFEDTNENITMQGKLSDYYANKSDNKTLKILTPILIDEVEGTLVNREERCVGQYLAVGFNKYGQRTSPSHHYTHIARITPSGIGLKALNTLTPKLPIDSTFSLDEKDEGKGKNRVLRTLSKPNVYCIDDDNYILDLSYTKTYGNWQANKNSSKPFETFQTNKEIYCPDFWKINFYSDQAIPITKDEFDKLNLRADYVTYAKNTRSYILNAEQKPHELHADYYKRFFKKGYGTFTVPDTEESMDRFFQDSKGNIFNYGYCAVYNKSCKGHIGTKRCTYMNMYSKSGELLAKIKFKGTAEYVMERDGCYFICTQQDMRNGKPAVTRLYKLDL